MNLKAELNTFVKCQRELLKIISKIKKFNYALSKDNQKQ